MIALELEINKSNSLNYTNYRPHRLVTFEGREDNLNKNLKDPDQAEEGRGRVKDAPLSVTTDARKSTEQMLDAPETDPAYPLFVVDGVPQAQAGHQERLVTQEVPRLVEFKRRTGMYHYHH